ncbi:septum formation protein Maf [Thiohalocapsa halophila]|uniref:dTTP/UTP pyrophosphatase n=1 Tax=Thiohalocapsa halophila TaxID=69359 RepID=A0ABS1CG78_9GAMM|nr:nucleoside triphosphate pyrophosphatase [Thiohalocapsa halophila]MBK1630863.1 septum formation protein Maf [Thiohalocapsa halophila]
MVLDETLPPTGRDDPPRLILASKSPRRRELLRQIGLTAEVRSADVDESPARGEAPADYVLRIALAKARAVRAALGRGTAARPVLAADTAVICDDRILGKPADAAEAARMLALLSARTHQVLTGVALLGAAERTVVSSTRVWLRAVSAAEAAVYWASGEPQDKAGGYGLQGLGAVFVERLEGSWSGVVGLPLFETAQLLAAEGLPLLSAD